jgi:hypothetical protein
MAVYEQGPTAEARGGEGPGMDHSYIEAHQIAERYLMGRLSPGEATRFEEHSLACPECLERLETAETLRLGLRQVAAEQAAATAAVRLGLLARLARSRSAPWVLALLFLVAVLPAGLLLRQVGRLDRELARAKEPRPPQGLEAELAMLRARVAAQDRQAASDRRQRERLATELEQAREPRINVPIVPLSPERSAPGAPPAARLALSPSSDWVVLSLDLGGAPEYPGYRAVLTGPGGRVRWRASGLHPDAQDALTVALPASGLEPGDFAVRVEGLPARGEPAAVADFSFRVVRRAAG